MSVQLSLESWASYKTTVCEEKGLAVQYGTTSSHYEVVASEPDSQVLWVYSILRVQPGDPAYEGSDCQDFELYVQPSANKRDAARDADGRLKVHPVTVSAGQWHYWHGEGDGASTVGGGQAFQVSRTDAGEEVVEWGYRDQVWLTGGTFTYTGAALGDCVSFSVVAPATPISGAGGSGNCNLVGGILVPAAGNGAYNVDLSEAIPVPSQDSTGYWDYEPPSDLQGKGTCSAGAPGASRYHLVPAEVTLVQFVKAERLLGSNTVAYEPQNVKGSACLPEWKFRCVLKNSAGGHTVTGVWRILCSRYHTA